MCVPILISSLIGLGRHAPLGNETGNIYQAHVGLIFLVFILAWYLSLDTLAGIVASVVYVTGYLLSNHFFLQNRDAFSYEVMWIQIICWSAQFIGHGVFENRRPALLDNIFLTLAAPMFVVLEVMMVFGYKTHLHKLLKDVKNS